METSELTVADGRVESARDGVVTGWAWSPPAPDVRVRVAVWIDGRIAATGQADRHEPGLEKAGVGDGHHGFAIELPDELTREQELAVAVRVAGVSQRLTMLSGWNAQGDGEWAGVRMVVDDRPPPAPPIADDPPPAVPEPAAAALAGRDGWLFAHPRDGAGRTAVDDVAADLQRSAEALAALGIRYVVAVAPPKLAVYPDRALLHPAVAASGAARALEQLARDSDVLEILDLRQVLADARRHGDLFLPRDEQWSALGALHVQRALIKRAGLSGLHPTPIADATFAPALERPADALAGLPVVGPAGDGAEPVAPHGIDAAWPRAQRVPAGEHLETEGLPAARVYERPGSEELPRVVLVGDPCIHAVGTWLAEISSRLIVFSSPSAPMVPIELEHPAVVFHVLEERRVGA